MKKGFTLIELLAVIVIIAIISLIAIPQISNLVNNVRLKADLESVRGYINAADTYYMKAQFDSNLYSTLGTNVIDKLPVKGEKLNGSVIINDKGKIELSIIKNKKCYRKSFNDTELEVVEEGMCSIANAKSVSQAGQLHVCGRFLCDKDNNTVRIVGISGGMLGSQAELTNPSSLPVRGEINATSLKTLRSWGANGYRIFAEAKIPGVASYIGYEDQFISKVKQVIDAAIEADMYIIVNWDPARNGGVPFTDQAMDFFNRISTMYKNDPHILYEIWNEPEANNSWDQIKAHADKIIPVIRKNSPNAIVLVGSPSANLKLDLVVNDPLKYPNVMYTHHMYMSSLTDEAVSKLVNAYNAGLPIFETEWGSMGLGLNDPMVMKPQAKAYVSLLNRLGISNLAFTFATSTDIDDNRFGIVVRGNWRDDLPDSILKENGKFYKNVLQGGTGDLL